MNDSDLKQLFTTALEEPAPDGIDVTAVVHEGRRRKVRRTVGAGAGVVSSLAVVAAVALGGVGAAHRVDPAATDRAGAARSGSTAAATWNLATIADLGCTHLGVVSWAHPVRGVGPTADAAVHDLLPKVLPQVASSGPLSARPTGIGSADGTLALWFAVGGDGRPLAAISVSRDGSVFAAEPEALCMP